MGPCPRKRKAYPTYTTVNKAYKLAPTNICRGDNWRLTPTKRETLGKQLGFCFSAVINHKIKPTQVQGDCLVIELPTNITINYFKEKWNYPESLYCVVHDIYYTFLKKNKHKTYKETGKCDLYFKKQNK